MAYRTLATEYVNLYGPARAAMYYTKAYELRDHASERERMLITADYYANLLGDLKKATGAYEELIASIPATAGHKTRWASCTQSKDGTSKPPGWCVLGLLRCQT